MGKRSLIYALVVCAAAVGVAAVATTAIVNQALGDQTHGAVTRTGASGPLDKFWTKDRIENAKPVDSLRGAERGGERGADGVAPGSSADSPGAVEPGAREQAVGPDTEKYPPRTIPGTAPAGELTTKPGLESTTGRLYFSVGDDTFMCSATVVASHNMSVIATARHCGFNDNGTNYRFAPAYHDGEAPYGWWDWKSAGVVTGGDGVADDVAFIVLQEQDGKRVGDVVGTDGLGFNQPADNWVHLVGIPGDTDAFRECQGQSYPNPDGQGGRLLDDCAGLAGGASGGSMNVDVQPEGWGYQVGTFFGSVGDAAAASRFGDAAFDVWSGAQDG